MFCCGRETLDDINWMMFICLLLLRFQILMQICSRNDQTLVGPSFYRVSLKSPRTKVSDSYRAPSTAQLTWRKTNRLNNLGKIKCRLCGLLDYSEWYVKIIWSWSRYWIKKCTSYCNRIHKKPPLQVSYKVWKWLIVSAVKYEALNYIKLG